MNKLEKETSPYLLDHKNNPVEWYPWNEDSLKKAKKEKKPILLSIGYSACHWCHVMAHESFENKNIAALMNKYFSDKGNLNNVHNYTKFYHAIFEKKTQSFELVFAHNDYYHKNILDDGKKLWLVDWEFSGFNSPLLDLANVSKNNELSEDDDNFILEEYYGDSFDSNFKYKFHMQKCVSLLNGVLWSMIAEIFSKKVFDYVSYTNKMLKRYEKQFDYYSSLKI